VAAAPTRIDKYLNDLAKLRSVFERLAKDGELRAYYEASGGGYVLQRAMRAWDYHCDVIAPSLIPTKPGVQRKHDKYDAGQLARLYRAGELTGCAFRAKRKSGCAISCGAARRCNEKS
jgi:hypothetical protein